MYINVNLHIYFVIKHNISPGLKVKIYIGSAKLVKRVLYKVFKHTILHITSYVAMIIVYIYG